MQAYPVKEPYLLADKPFEPFGLGYVDVGPVRVQARLTTADPDKLAIGMPMALTLVTLGGGEDAVLTYAFAPSG